MQPNVLRFRGEKQVVGAAARSEAKFVHAARVLLDEVEYLISPLQFRFVMIDKKIAITHELLAVQ